MEAAGGREGPTTGRVGSVWVLNKFLKRTFSKIPTHHFYSHPTTHLPAGTAVGIAFVPEVGDVLDHPVVD